MPASLSDGTPPLCSFLSVLHSVHWAVRLSCVVDNRWLCGSDGALRASTACAATEVQCQDLSAPVDGCFCLEAKRRLKSSVATFGLRPADCIIIDWETRYTKERSS